MMSFQDSFDALEIKSIDGVAGKNGNSNMRISKI